MKGLNGQELDLGWSSLERFDSGQSMLPIFNADSPPDVGQSSSFTQGGVEKVRHTIFAFGQNLIRSRAEWEKTPPTKT